MDLFLIIISFMLIGIFSLIFVKYLFLGFFVMFVDSKRKKQSKSASEYDVDKKSNDNIKKIKLKSFLFRFYEGCYRYLMEKISMLPSNFIRVFFYKRIFRMKIGKHVVIHHKLEIRDGFKIVIGNGTVIGDSCLLDGRGGLEIGQNCNFSSNVSVYTMEHDYNSSDFGGKSLPVVIGNRVWLSCNTIVLPGVTIEEGGVLAAGAVATKKIDGFSVYVGIPAKKKVERSKELVYQFDGKTCWFY